MCAEQARKSPVVKASIARWTKALLNFMREAGCGRVPSKAGQVDALGGVAVPVVRTLERWSGFLQKTAYRIE